MPRVGLLSFVLIFFSAGCANKTYAPIIDGWSVADEEMSVIYVPPEKTIYLEISKGASRYADFQVSAGANLLSAVAGGAIGTWLGTTGTLVASGLNPGNWLVAVSPVTLAVVLGVPLVNSALEVALQAKARDRTKRFEVLRDNELDVAFFISTVESVLSDANNLGFGGAVVKSVTDTVLEDVDVDDFVESDSNNTILVVGSKTVFTPRFEVIEITLFYGVVQKNDEGEGQVIYNSGVVVQSKLRSGLDGSDTRNEVSTIREWAKKRLLTDLNESQKRYTRMGARERLVARQRIIDKFKRKQYVVPDEYAMIDDRDIEGNVWYADNGYHFHDQIEASFEEAVRLMIADLAGQASFPSGEIASPPGYDVKLQRESSFDTPTREIYRLENGALVSIDKLSRMIPLSADML